MRIKNVLQVMLLSLASRLLFISPALAQDSKSKPLPQLGKSSLKEVIAAMTLEEKAKLVVGAGFRMPGAQRNAGANTGTQPPVKVPGAAGTTFAIPRLGIPSITVSDGPAGVRISAFRNNDSSRSYYATAFPVGTLLASSWDTALAAQMGKAFGQELKEYGIDILLAPALNIHRNPLGGRNFEYFSEDPLIAGSMTAALVNGIESNGVGTSIKHFAANNQETNRNTVNTIVSERALREIYLKGFEIAVKKSQPWTVMSSYNLLNGTYTSQDSDLLTTILRKEWGFKGFVMSDWFGGVDPVEQMKAGNDLLMPGTPDQSKAIMQAVNDGKVSEKILDQNIERILNIILLSPSFKKYTYSDRPDLEKDAAISRRAATESMVLLRNESNTLPLGRARKVALFGNASYNIIAGGTGSGDVNKAYTISLLQGLMNAGYQINHDLADEYIAHIMQAKARRPRPRGFFSLPEPIAELLPGDDAIDKLANEMDVAIFTIGRNAGEGNDRKLENDFNLSDTETVLMKKISGAFHAKGKKFIVVINAGGVIEVNSWRNDADAILLAWQPGLEAGNAIVDLLSGKVNPSGKLATSFPIRYEDVPSAKNFPGKEFPEKAVTGSFGRKLIPAEVQYEEGIYVGYRYYSSFNVKTAYEFGYGLSYTQFAYGGLTVSKPNAGGKMSVTITVTNSGRVAGKEVVQLYLSAPGKTMDKPAEELKAFAKTSLLGPGRSEIIRFTLNASDLASFDTKSSSWVAEAGNYKIQIGASSTDIRQSASFVLPAAIVTERDHKVLAPQVELNEMKSEKKM